jgi:hypothetical protein
VHEAITAVCTELEIGRHKLVSDNLNGLVWHVLEKILIATSQYVASLKRTCFLWHIESRNLFNIHSNQKQLTTWMKLSSIKYILGTLKELWCQKNVDVKCRRALSFNRF